MRYERNLIPILISVFLVGASVSAEEVDKTGQPVVSQVVSINDAVGIALTNSPTLEARRAAVAAAAARVGMAKSMTRPQASASTFATSSNMPMILPGFEGVRPQNFTLTPNEARLDQNVMAMYPLYTGGALKGRVGGARALAEASLSDAATSELDAALAVKSAYYNVLLQREVVTAYQQRVNEATERVRIAQVSFDAGRIARFDLLRNQTDLAEAEQQKNNAERDETTALIDLKNAMGISQSSTLTLSDSLTFTPEQANAEDLQARAVAQRPEVAAARARIRSAEAGLGVARSAYKPQIYAAAMAEGSATHQDGTDTGYLVGVTAALPIFDGGLRKSAKDEAQAMLRQMRADEREAILMVVRDVAASVTQLGAAAKNVTLSEAAVAQADEGYRVTRLRYEAGKSTNVEVLDALATLTRAQTSHAEALYNFNVARETLTRAMGQR